MRRAIALCVGLALASPAAALSAKSVRTPVRPAQPYRSPVLMTAATPMATSAAIFGATNLLGLSISAVFKGCHYHLDLRESADRAALIPAQCAIAELLHSAC
jgi:hypothetical protein